MRENLGGVVVRLGVFLAVCLLTAFLLIAVFGEVRFGDGKTYYAEFANVSNLRTGKLVRIAGVEVGKVTRISINPDATVRVQFTADNSVTLTRGTRAVIRYDNLFGDRYLALEEGAGGLAVLRPGHTIPLARTQPALDLDALIGGFKPLFRALNPEQVNALSEQLLHAFAGQGPTIGSLLAQSAAVTNTLADRDRLIGQVITNLNVVLGSLGAHTDRLDQAVTCTTGFLPAQQRRIPTFEDYPDRPAGDLYCRVPQDSPFNVRRARNIPCETVPGKRAPTVKLCESDEPYLPLNDGYNWKGDPNATVPGLGSGQDIPQTWQTMLLPPGS